MRRVHVALFVWAHSIITCASAEPAGSPAEGEGRRQADKPCFAGGGGCAAGSINLLQKQSSVSRGSMGDRRLTGATSTTVSVQGRQLLIDGTPVHLKGVNWNPVDRGDDQSTQGSNAINFAGWVDADSDLMVEAGINVVRTYVTLTDTAVLDTLYDKGIYVMNTVLEYYTQTLADVENRVNLAKDHPAVIMWVVGNEWNYNGLYRSHDCAHDWSCMQDTQQQLRDAAYRIKATDPTRPVSTIYGELPDQGLVDWFGDSIDVWGINVYSGKEFGDRFDRWAATSGKPMYFGEYGADAWNANIGGVDESAQAEATTALTEDIVDHSAVTGGVCIGGIIFEFNDEWWKAGNAWAHDAGGVAPGGGPWPDFTFNEEYWGLVTIDRVRREAFHAYRDVASPGPVSPGPPISTPAPSAAPPAPAPAPPAPAPAPPAPAPAPPAPAPAPPVPSGRWHRRRASPPSTPPPTPPPSPPAPVDTTCGEPSEECQGNLDWAMNTGIYSNPEWYPGLTPESSSDEFQLQMSTTASTGCLPPCSSTTPAPACGEASEKCEENLDWSMNTGIYSNPEWYPGLTPESSRDEFQESLSENPDMNCLPPCA